VHPVAEDSGQEHSAIAELGVRSESPRGREDDDAGLVNEGAAAVRRTDGGESLAEWRDEPVLRPDDDLALSIDESPKAGFLFEERE
jgi:hypothetical protein